MSYGPHTSLVEEVVAFASSPGVLSAVGPAEEHDDVWITNDLRLAIELNGGVGENGHFPMAPDVDASDWGNSDLLGYNLDAGQGLIFQEIGDLGWIWEDLTENLIAQLISPEGERNPSHRTLFKVFNGAPLEKRLAARLRAFLPHAEPLPGWEHCADQVAHNIVMDLRYCAENRAVNGQTDNFWERMFQLFRQGLWPCGWRGTYPAPGKFAAYRIAR